jgi:hypothetical protein
VNITKFLPLISDSSIDKLENEIESFQPRHIFNSQARDGSRLNGTWVPLKIARQFAESHDISQKLAPILSFERIAMTTYSGYDMYETFVHLSVDVSIRVLREVSTGRINMDQIFSVYNKVRGDQALTILQRSIYFHFKNIRVRGDATMCGGHWMEPNDVAKFARKHGIIQFVKLICGFKTTPDETELYPMDVFERASRIFWVATVCDADFYGFPSSFKGGLAPKSPPEKNGKNRTEFSYDELVAGKTINIELTKRGEFERHRLLLLRRLSDGWVNCSVLVRICVMIRLTELDLSEDDPDLRIENELHFRDVLERYPYEVIVSPKSKNLNGKWCSAKDALVILSLFKVRQTTLGKHVEGLLNSPVFKELDEMSDIEDEDDDEELEMVDEKDFLEMRNQIKKKDIYFDPKFFENGTSSDEESLELHGVTDEEDSDSDTLMIDPKNVPEEEGHFMRNRTFVLSDSDESDDGVVQTRDVDIIGIASRKKSRSVEQEDQHIEVSTAGSLERHSSIDSLFESPQENSESAVNFLDTDELVKKIRVISVAIEQLLADVRKVRTARVQRLLTENLRKLQYFNAVTSEIKVKSKLNTTLHSLNALNVGRKEIQNLEERWAYESALSRPSVTLTNQKPRVWPPPVDYNAKPVVPRNLQPQQINVARGSPAYQFGFRNSPPALYTDQSQNQAQSFRTHVSPPYSNGPVAVPSPNIAREYHQYNNVQHQRYPYMGFLGPNLNQIPPQQQGPGPQLRPSRGPPNRYSNPDYLQHPKNQPCQNNLVLWQQYQGQNPNSHAACSNFIYQGKYYGNLQANNGSLSMNRRYNANSGPPYNNRGPPPPSQQQQQKQQHERPFEARSYDSRGHDRKDLRDPRMQDPRATRNHPAKVRSNTPTEAQNYKYFPRRHVRNESDGFNHESELVGRACERPINESNPQKSVKRITVNPKVKVGLEQNQVELSRSLSPPTNFCDLTDELPDLPSFGLNDFLSREAEKIEREEKEQGSKNEALDSPQMSKFKKVVEFEIGTHQDLLWRHDIIFNDKDRVPMVKKIMSLIQETNKRKSKR